MRKKNGMKRRGQGKREGRRGGVGGVMNDNCEGGEDWGVELEGRGKDKV